jgi:hypothetical protein
MNVVRFSAISIGRLYPSGYIPGIQGMNVDNIKEIFSKIERKCTDKIKVVQVYHFCKKCEESMRPLKRLTNSSPLRTSDSDSEESALK